MTKNNNYPKNRWFMLAIYMFITVVIELQWLTHAPIARVAEKYYAAQLANYSWLNIDSLAIIYMFVFIIMALPASYIIDTYGIKKGVSIGAGLTIIGSLIKGFWGHDLLFVFIGQLILAIAQPFIINAVTAFSVRWFPSKERAMAAGFAALAQYVGILLVMLVTPSLVDSLANSPTYGAGVDDMLFKYMIPSVLAGVLILLFFKEKPTNIAFNATEDRLPFKEGLKHMMTLRDAKIIFILFIFGLGIFNAISSLVDDISANLNIVDSDGLVGGVMLIGGIIGAIILPVLSDVYQKRKLFIIICMIGFVISVSGMAFAAELTNIFNLDASNTYVIALVSSFFLGFSIMSAGPIGFQYTAEVTAPTPESTSQGVLLLAGQISGIAMVMIMGMDNNKYLDICMKSFVVMSVVIFFLVLMLKESPIASKKETIN